MHAGQPCTQGHRTAPDVSPGESGPGELALDIASSSPTPARRHASGTALLSRHHGLPGHPLDTLKNANLALRFLLELAALSALAVWGWTASSQWWLRSALAIAAPALAAAAWGLFVSPKARVTTHWAIRAAVEAAVFAAAAAALLAGGWTKLGLAFIALAVISRSIKTLFDLRQPAD